ncbi:hypothetical protein BC936DRAFT_138363 [Jimgerdemannia flammicorona]|uniref:Uncharacterized protein n=1 Tax=Jimgerdemannia flammicorona TaxID=994334 RepID=A0A433DMX3_9FUNG|nr:hypothetical protein BC936DRAFT_138363 [Jimgerdemannia flammicorona]
MKIYDDATKKCERRHCAVTHSVMIMHKPNPPALSCNLVLLNGPPLLTTIYFHNYLANTHLRCCPDEAETPNQDVSEIRRFARVVVDLISEVRLRAIGNMQHSFGEQIATIGSDLVHWLTVLSLRAQNKKVAIDFHEQPIHTKRLSLINVLRRLHPQLECACLTLAAISDHQAELFHGWVAELKETADDAVARPWIQRIKYLNTAVGTDRVSSSVTEGFSVVEEVFGVGGVVVCVAEESFDQGALLIDATEGLFTFNFEIGLRIGDEIMSGIAIWCGARENKDTRFVLDLRSANFRPFR